MSLSRALSWPFFIKLSSRWVCRSLNTSKTRCLENINKASGSVAASDIKECLVDSKLIYEDGHSSFIVTPCPFCSKHESNESTLFINKTTGGSVCKPCNLKGPWSDVSKMLKGHKQNKSSTKPSSVNERLEKLCPSTLPKDFWTDNCIPWRNANPSLREMAVDIFNISELDTSIIEKYGLSFTKAEFPLANGTCEVQPCVVFPWFSSEEGDLVPERIKIESMRPSTSGGGDRLVNYMPKEGSPGLFGWNTIPKNASQLVITTQEFDAIAVHQATGLPAVCLPMGSISLPPEVLPQLENFTAIYLWFGSDARDRQASAQFARKLNASRCFIIGPSSEREQFTSALDALNKDLDFREIIDNAKPAEHKQIMTFQQLREEVYSEFLNADQVSGVKWQRFPELTRILKGFRPGEVTIFTGPTGSGKTTIMSELSLDLCSQGVSTLWGSFEIRNVRLVKTMLRQYSGINLEKHLNKYQYWADRYQQLPLYYMGFHGPMETNTVIETMSHSVYVHDIQHIIIDNLQFMIGNRLRGFDDSFFAQNNAVAQFRHFANSMNVHVTIIMHPRKEDEKKPLQTSSIYGTAKATQEADNVLILQSVPKKDKYLQITKNRFSGNLGKVPICFDKSNLTMSGVFKHSKQEKNEFKKNLSKEHYKDKIHGEVAKYNTPVGVGMHVNNNQTFNQHREDAVVPMGTLGNTTDRGGSFKHQSNMVAIPSTIPAAANDTSLKPLRNQSSIKVEQLKSTATM